LIYGEEVMEFRNKIFTKNVFLKIIEEFGRALGIIALDIAGKPLASMIY
jgi:hypothetical protein